VTVTAPPRPPGPSDPIEREELEALVEALIEEARKRARRRRLIYGAVAAVVALVGVAVFLVFERTTTGTAQSQTASAALAAQSSRPAAPASSRIVFRDDRRGNGEIYVMNADGSGLRRLTRDVASDGAPAWSPDGRRIAFRSDSDGNGEIYVMNADGSAERNLTRTATSEGGLHGGHVWSPDGRSIAFVRAFVHRVVNGREGNADVYVMNADGSRQRRLARGTVSPVWSTGQWHVLTPPSPTWSLDGRKIAFVSNRGGNFDVYVMNPDGSSQRNVTRTPGDELYPAWSPAPRN
jgi:Tol biopolymer transport system component